MTSTKGAKVTVRKKAPRVGGRNDPAVAWAARNGLSQLFHGDVFDLAERIPEASFDCIWTDPPYFLSNNGVTCVSGKRVSVNKGTWDKSKGLTVDHEFNRRWLTICYRLLKPTGTIWISGTSHVYFSVGMALQEVGFRLLNDIVWEKPNPPPNLGCRCFTHATEMVLWATKAIKGKKPSYTFNYEAMRAANQGKQMKNVWRMYAPSKQEKELGKHPTQKPLELITRCLEASTLPGDIIFDPFSGSGSTGVAALATGRRFVGCERERTYVALAARRLNEVDGIKRHSQS